MTQLDGRWRPLAVVAATIALLAVGCTPDRAPEPDGLSPEEPAITSDLDAKPDLLPLLPDDRGEPPDELVVEDLVAGDGAVAEPGADLIVHFVGAFWASGQEFDASWDRGQPFTFTLGAGEVIPGWEQGVAGMRVGGRRALVVPPDLAYGERGSAAIAPGETLVFVVDLLEVSTG